MKNSALAPIVIAALGLVTLAQAPTARAAEPVQFVALLEGGVGGGAQAQGYVDQLVAGFAKRCGWPGAASLYTNSRERALEYMNAEHPAFGLFSLGAYLALVDAHKLTVVGVAEAKRAGGRQYFVVAKQGTSLADCKGQRLASNHADDPLFIDHVVLAGAARLADFDLVPTRRPVQTLKAVIRDEARCALIDDAQKESLSSVEGGAELKPLWASAELPGIPIVALEGTNKDLVAAFKQALPDTCSGDQALCTNIGIERLQAASDADYAALVRRYHARDVARP
ncbi:MAG: hypothetical protein CVU56_22700 [Deltaproteobacteria bacterium HGW-Deltaproteobacteria-14]|jgi:ABC-type phosphate/phosphonate transport system substrate-binding protein|nr:MAG: hypothetical protein CVU56_22700 [Deltaproteobacteria bacterium HGW-Deltaproteobacteria-14]